MNWSAGSLKSAQICELAAARVEGPAMDGTGLLILTATQGRVRLDVNAPNRPLMISDRNHREVSASPAAALGKCVPAIARFDSRQ